MSKVDLGTLGVEELIGELRGRGYAVTAFGPEDEMEGCDFSAHGGFGPWLRKHGGHIEDAMAEAGAERMTHLTAADRIPGLDW